MPRLLAEARLLATLRILVIFETTVTFYELCSHHPPIRETRPLRGLGANSLAGGWATMQRISALVGLAVTALSSGCTMYLTGASNLWNEPKYAFEDFQHARKARSLAKASWERRSGRVRASEDFARGYIDGYADYLIAGRTTDPRPTPPKRYLKFTVHTPESMLAIEDYYAGFHAGAIDAEASGLRQRMVVPVVVPIPCETATGWSSRQAMEAKSPAEPLPAPRELEPQELPSRPSDLPKSEN